MTNKIKQKLESLVSKAKTLKGAVSPKLKHMGCGIITAAGWAAITGAMAYCIQTEPQASKPALYALSAISSIGILSGAYLTAMSAQWAIDDYKLAKSKKNTA